MVLLILAVVLVLLEVYLNLHSNMVLLKYSYLALNISTVEDLHSNMVLLKLFHALGSALL